MLAVMEDLLDSWPGTILLVSHDRYLTERVTDDQFALLDGKLRHVPGGVDEYLRLLDKMQADNQCQPQQLSLVKQVSIDSHQLRKQISSIERKLHTLQNKDVKLTEQMHEVDPSDFQQLITLGEQQRELRQQMEQLEQEWLENAELLDAT